MRKTVSTVLAFSLVATQLAGCATMSNTEQGTGIGAATGAVIGAAVSNNKIVGALVGAAVGALAGAVIGNYIDQQNATRAEAAKKYTYDGRGEKLEVESVDVAPQKLNPGGTMAAAVRYTVLAPDSSKQVKLTERRTLVSGHDSFDLPVREVTCTQGTHTSTAKVTLPKDLTKGNYTLVTTISDGKNTKSSKTSFVVA